MTGGFIEGNIFRGLAFRILVFLSLALLPFGLIAVVQTQEIARQAERNSQSALLGQTDLASNQERTAIQRGFGTADALGSIIGLYLRDPGICSRFLSDYQRSSEQYSFVGFLSADGIMRCSSTGVARNLANDPNYKSLVTPAQRAVFYYEKGRESQVPVLVLLSPVFEGENLAGYVMLSIPTANIRQIKEAPLERPPFAVVIFNANGDVLLSDIDAQTTQTNLPMNRSLAALVGEKQVVFSDRNQGNVERVYSLSPIVPGVIYSLGVWRSDDIIARIGNTENLSIFLPILMWLASLIVAFWSLNRSAVRHIKKLGRQMRHFAFNRTMPRKTLGQGVPRELQDIQLAFVGMAESIIRDEAALEDNIREKNILLKEVHHRVKNNLQLISSIMNMQIRRAQSDDARFVLQRLQERILSLATVHKSLYQTDALDRVDAGMLVQEIVGQLLVIGLPAGSDVEVIQSFDTVLVDADDAAPVTLLVSEAVTNALKYIGKPSDGVRAMLNISLTSISPTHAKFEIINSTDGAKGSEGTGLGAQLINAFARQLNGTVDVFYEDNLHRLVLTFPVIDRDKTVRDY